MLLTKKDDWLWAYILKIAQRRFSDWKYRCKKFLESHPDSTRLEFQDRTEEWDWLVRHFKEDPNYKVLIT